MLTMILLHACCVMLGFALIFPDVISIKMNLGLMGKKFHNGVKTSMRRKVDAPIDTTMMGLFMNIVFTIISVGLSMFMFVTSLTSGFGAGFSISLVGIGITLGFQYLNHFSSYKLFKTWVAEKRSMS